MQTVRILEMPDCRMVSSGIGMFGEEKMETFDAWMSSQKRGLHPKDFLFWDGHGFHWLYMYDEGMTVPPSFEIVDFKGGLYAVATGIDQHTDQKEMNAQVDWFLGENGFQRDATRPEMGHIITSPMAREIMGYEQMDYYMPIMRKAD